jgi:hypothetical protein
MIQLFQVQQYGVITINNNYIYYQATKRIFLTAKYTLKIKWLFKKKMYNKAEKCNSKINFVVFESGGKT